MKQAELLQSITCSKCKKSAGDASLVFYRVKVESYMLDVGAINRQLGLEAMFAGNGPIAAAMGPDADLANKLNSWNVTLCLDCALDPDSTVAEALELDKAE